MYISENLPVAGNAFIWVADLGPKTLENKTNAQILSKLIKEPYYSDLRTKQQTGYIVHSNTFVAANKRLFLQTAVQSNTHDARDLLSRTELFFESWLRNLNNAELQERFDSVKTSMLARLKKPHDSMESKLRFQAHLAFDEDGDFSYLDKKIAHLESLTFEEWQPFALEKIGRDNPNRLAFLVEGNDPENTKFSYSMLAKL